jgi:DnaJ domain
MAANRRNYYRLLHVQADAPAEVVKAAYRALIRTHHPDAGGDHQVAAMLNEAYGVLSDPAQRAAYDAKRPVRPLRSAGDPIRSARGRDAGAVRQTCAFCQLLLPNTIRSETRCVRCQAPLAVPRPAGRSANADERRGVIRVTKSDWGILRTSWLGDAIDVRMRDLSLGGISIYAGSPLAEGTTMRIVAAAADVVAHLVSCRRVDKVFTIHARIATAIFKSQTGGFVSTMA